MAKAYQKCISKWTIPLTNLIMLTANNTNFVEHIILYLKNPTDFPQKQRRKSLVKSPFFVYGQKGHAEILDESTVFMLNMKMTIAVEDLMLHV